MNEVIELLHQLSRSFDEIRTYILSHKKSEIQSFKNTWIDGQEVIQTLHISKRTLQSLRDTGMLPYSRLNGKFYYRMADLHALLNKNYNNVKQAGHESK